VLHFPLGRGGHLGGARTLVNFQSTARSRVPSRGTCERREQPWACRAAFAARRAACITVDDVAELLLDLRRKGCSAKTSASALATLQSILRYARRRGWIAEDPVDLLEPDERPRPAPRRQRVLGRDEIERLLAACGPRDRLMITTVLYTGLRVSEMLGLTWDDIDFAADVIHVRARLSRAHRDAPARRVAPKTPASVRDIPIVAQLARLLAAHKQRTPFAAGPDWVLATSCGTPHGHRNVTQRGLQRAARIAGLDGCDWPPLRFHDLRHTFASHLIVDSGSMSRRSAASSGTRA
jgi:integrase